jgi:predicted nucleic acid-binding protein
MKTVLIDACSAILLYKAGLFDNMTQAHALVVTAAVFKELTVATHPGAAAFDQAYRGASIQVLDLTNRCKPEPAWAAGLGAGERDTLLAFEPLKADYIVIDDRRGVRCCRERHVPHINALLCPLTLNAVGLIGVDRCRQAFDHLTVIGRYNRSVIDYARNCTIEGLKAFWPAAKD